MNKRADNFFECVAKAPEGWRSPRRFANTDGRESSRQRLQAISMNWVEGPSATKIGGECYIYFDHYGDPQYYGAIKSTDMKNWQDISAMVSFPKGIRHGTVLTVPESVVQRIQNH